MFDLSSVNLDMVNAEVDYRHHAPDGNREPRRRRRAWRRHASADGETREAMSADRAKMGGCPAP